MKVFSSIVLACLMMGTCSPYNGKACPDTKTYGDSSSENFLEFGKGEKAYRFYFDQPGYVKYKKSEGFELYLPGFGSISGPLAHLQLNFNKIIGSDAYDAYDITLKGSEALGPYPCVNVSKVFEKVDSVKTDVQEFLYSKYPNSNKGTFKSTFKLENRHNASEYIKGKWETNKIIEDTRHHFKDKKYSNRGFISSNGKSENIKYAWVNYDGNQNALKFSLKPDRMPTVTRQINNFQGPGNYIQMENGEVYIYKVKRLEPHSARVTIHRLPAEKLGYDQQSFFSPNLPNPDSLDLESLGVYAHTKTRNVTYVPATSPVRFRGLQSNKTNSQLDLTKSEEKAAQKDVRFRKIKPSDQTYFAQYQNPERNNPFGIEDKAWSFFLFPNVTLKPTLKWSAPSGNPAGYNEALNTYHSFRQIQREFEQEDPDTAGYLEEVAELWKAKGFKGKAPQEAGNTEAAIREALLAKYEEKGLELVLNTLKTATFDDYPVKLKIDKKTGLPVERTHRLPGNTSVTINYEGQDVKVMAENPKQGKHTKTINTVDNILDMHQLHHNLAYLPLEKGYKSRLPFLDIQYKDTTYQTKEKGKVSKLMIEPVYMLAFPEVKGVTEIENSEGKQVEAYEVNMEFRGAVNQFPAYGLLNAGKGPSYSLTYYMRKEAPHQIIKITSNDHDQVLNGLW